MMYSDVGDAIQRWGKGVTTVTCAICIMVGLACFANHSWVLGLIISIFGTMLFYVMGLFIVGFGVLVASAESSYARLENAVKELQDIKAQMQFPIDRRQEYSYHSNDIPWND